MEIWAEEELLLSRALQRDAGAIKHLVEKHQAWLYALAFRLTQDLKLAQDASIDALTQALNDIEPLRQKDSFRILAARHLVHFLKSRKIMPPKSSIEERLNLADPLPRDRKMMMSLFIAGLQRLSFEERALILLREQGHLSHKAIAEILRLKTSSLPKRIAEIRQKLQMMVNHPLENSLEHGL